MEFNLAPISDMGEIKAALGDLVFKFQHRTILIPGGYGFLGRMFTAFLVYLNRYVFTYPCKVILVDNFVVGQNPGAIGDNQVVSLTHDLTTPLYLKLDRGTKIDFVINCAGVASPSAYLKVPLEVMDVSYIGTKNNLELALVSGARVLNFSSSECYGDPTPDMIPTPESYIGQVSSTGKRSPYDIGKKTVEALSHVFRTRFGVNVSIVLPFNVYGYMARDDWRVIPNFVWAAHENRKLSVYAPGDQTRTFCFYTDFIAGALRVLLAGDEFAYNVGMQEGEISMKNLAGTVESVFERTGLVTLVDPPPAYESEPKRRCPDISKARSIGYDPKIDLNTGLQRIRTWIQHSAS